MIRLQDLFSDVEEKLPKGCVIHSLSVFPLPYKDYYEVFVETVDKKRYRCLATLTNFLSPMTEMEFLQGTPKVK